MNKKVFAVSMALLCLHNTTRAGVDTIALDEWHFVGSGFAADVDDALLVSEYPDSLGVMLISPDAYDCGVSIKFEVLPLNPESVLVVMLDASDVGAESTLSLPDAYDGDVGHLLNNVDAYFVAFHNAAHNRTPFVRRHPFIRGESSDLDAAETNVMSTRWHAVEVSHDGKGHLRLFIDDRAVLDAQDADPLSAGNLALRLRGTKTHVASALFRNVTITSCDDG